MYITTLLATLLAATTTLANPIRPSPNAQAAASYHNANLCMTKNPAIVSLVEKFCVHNADNDLTIGSAWARNGLEHDGWKVSVTGEACPKDNRWIPNQFCEGQFYYICAHGGGDQGEGTGRYGFMGCQTWRIGRAF